MGSRSIRLSHRSNSARSIRSTIPPTTPPMIAPRLLLLEFDPDAFDVCAAFPDVVEGRTVAWCVGDEVVVEVSVVLTLIESSRK